MSLQDIEAYWKDWVARKSEGDPFSFWSGKGNGKAREERGEEEGDGDGDDDEEDEEKGKEGKKNQRDGKDDGDEDDETIPAAEGSPAPLGPEFDIDKGILLPCQCETPALRTTCLQKLAPEWGNVSKTFHNLVKLVDTLKVSLIVNHWSLHHLI